MTNREAHPDYASYPVGMRVTRLNWPVGSFIEKKGDDNWQTWKGFFMDDAFIFDRENSEGGLGVIILHDPRTAGKPFAFAPVGDGTVKPSALLVALREAEAAIQLAIEMEESK